MERLDCHHLAAPHMAGRLCVHLLDRSSDAIDAHQHFHGVGLGYDLVCQACAERLKRSEPVPLRRVCGPCFQRARDDLFCDGVLGEPELRQRPSYRLKHLHVAPLPLSRAHVAALLPDARALGASALVLDRRGRLLSCDLEQHRNHHVIELGIHLDCDMPIDLQMSPCRRFLAVAQRYDTRAVIVDLAHNEVALELERGNYHVGHCAFPLAFIVLRERTVVIHGTEWNRLDATGLPGGLILTDRSTESEEVRQRLDYFQGQLHVSPDSRWLVSDGWVWGPEGFPRVFDLERWLHGFPGEADDLTMHHTLEDCWGAYLWDRPMCFLDARRLAIWGWGHDDERMIDAVMLLDVASGERISWFAGPRRVPLVRIDGGLLLSMDPERGASLWDPRDGAQVLHAPTPTLSCYHAESATYWGWRDEGTMDLWQLIDQP